MTSKTWVSGTTIDSPWLQDVDDFVYALPVVGAVGDGVTDDWAAIQAALNTGKKVKLFPGTYRITQPLSVTSGGLQGSGSKSTQIICDATHGIQILANQLLDRFACVVSDLGIRSMTGTDCDNKFAFYVPGVAGGAASAYNSGITVERVDIGRVGRMGGGFYLKDTFRCNIQNIGMTDVSRMIQLVGSNVQMKVRNVTSNNDSAGTTLSRYGISTETAAYSDIGTAGPENVRFIDCSYIRGTRGINHTTGLGIEFINFDTEADEYGAFINAPCILRGGVLAPGTGATAWVGVSRGVSIADPDDGTIIEDVDINCLRSPATPASSYGLDAGDGVSPVYGLVVRDLRIRGTAGSLQSAIRARLMSGDGGFYGNKIRSAVCLGTEVDIQSGRTLVMEDNIVPSGIIHVSDDGDTTAGGRIANNTASTLTTSLSSDNWSVYNPGILGGNTRAVGEFRSTVAGNITGCTLAVPITLRYVIHGRTVTLYTPSTTGTSNTTACTITGLPAVITPNRNQDLWGVITNNGSGGLGTFRITTGGVIELYVGANFAAFTAAGAKGVGNTAITYSLD
jgi:hypothetical protein